MIKQTMFRFVESFDPEVKVKISWHGYGNPQAYVTNENVMTGESFEWPNHWGNFCQQTDMGKIAQWSHDIGTAMQYRVRWRESA